MLFGMARNATCLYASVAPRGLIGWGSSPLSGMGFVFNFCPVVHFGVFIARLLCARFVFVFGGGGILLWRL